MKTLFLLNKQFTDAIRRISPIDVAVILSLLIALIVCSNNIEHILLGGGGDLRNRIVGARVIREGVDPYFFHWESGQSEALLDTRMSQSSLVSRLTVTPSVLLFHLPLAHWWFGKIILNWFVVEWIALLSCVASLIAFRVNTQDKKLVFIEGMIMASSYFWLTHTFTGQLYIVYGALISGALLFVSQRNSGLRLIGFFTVGVVAALRFPYVVFLIPLFFYNKKACVVAVVGLVATISLTTSVLGLSVWKNYFSSMNIYATTPLLSEAVAHSEQRTDNVRYPHVIEGLTFLNSFTHPLEYETSIKGVVQKSTGVLLPPKVLYSFGFIFAVWFVRQIAKRKQAVQKSVRYSFLLASLLMIGVEFFLPAARYSYYDVQFLLPIGLLTLLDKNTIHRAQIIGALLMAAYLPYFLPSNTLFLTYGIFLLLLHHALALGKGGH